MRTPSPDELQRLVALVAGASVARPPAEEERPAGVAEALACLEQRPSAKASEEPVALQPERLELAAHALEHLAQVTSELTANPTAAPLKDLHALARATRALRTAVASARRAKTAAIKAALKQWSEAAEIRPGKSPAVPAAAAYTHFTEWCRENGIHPPKLHQSSFSTFLRGELGVVRGHRIVQGRHVAPLLLTSDGASRFRAWAAAAPDLESASRQWAVRRAPALQEARHG